MPELDVKTSDTGAAGDKNGAGANGGAGAPSSATVTLPGWVEGQLGKERVEPLRAEVLKDPDLLKDISAIKGNGELFDSWRTLRDSSKGTIRIPKEGDGKEVWDQWFKAIGRPESPRDYAFEKPKLPEGMQYSEELENWFRTVAHENGISVKAAKTLFEGFNKRSTEAYTKATEQAKTAQEAAQKKAAEERANVIAKMTETLKREWGSDSYLRAKAAAGVLMAFPKETVDRLQAAGAFLDVNVIKFADNYVRATSEDRKLGLLNEGGEPAEPDVDERTGRHKMKVHVAKR